MLKHILILLMMIVSIPSFATDVTGGETCDTDVLNTDTGPVNLRAEFEPETINLRWYNNNTLLDTTSTNSNDCTYDAPINLPANPTKPGYKFKGWNIRPEYDFSTLDATQSKIQGYGKDEGGCYIPWSDRTCKNEDFNDLNLKEWKHVYNSGTIYGMAKCSSSQTTMDFQNGRYCWCLVTGYKPSNDNTIYRPKKQPSYYLTQPYNTVSECSRRCAFACGANPLVYQSML